MKNASEHLPKKNEATRLAVCIGGFSFGMWCAGNMPVALDPEHKPFLLPADAKHACHFDLGPKA